MAIYAIYKLGCVNMALFNRDLFLDNVYYLARKNDIKISELERSARVSPGYISRINKEANRASPSIEFFLSIAKCLNVNVDTLLHYPLNTKTPTELLIIKFIDALIKQTSFEEVVWKSNDVEKLTTVYYDEDDMPTSHTISEIRFFNGNYEAYYESPYHIGIGVKPLDEFYSVNIDKAVEIFFVKYQLPNEDGTFPHSKPIIEYDLLMVNRFEKEKLAHYNSYKESDIYNDKMIELNSVISDSSSRTHLSKNAKSAINDFLGIIDLPF